MDINVKVWVLSYALIDSDDDLFVEASRHSNEFEVIC